MPELPEVEVVRRGLATHLLGRRISEVQVFNDRAVRRHPGGAADFSAIVVGHRVSAVRRRGKYLWWALEDGDAILAHLGMSGQFRVTSAAEPVALQGKSGTSDASAGGPGVPLSADGPPAPAGGSGVLAKGRDHAVLVDGSNPPVSVDGSDDAVPADGLGGGVPAGRPDGAVPVGLPDESGVPVEGVTLVRHPHLRIRFSFDDGGPDVDFLDQRTFGGMSFAPGGAELPAAVAHIARDPLDPEFSMTAAVAAIRRKHTEIKRALLDQTVVSGIGNIYADEALWHAKVHYARATAGMTRAVAGTVLTAAAEVMREALDAGGTSFDALYVNVNGESGYFDRSLNAYGQQDRPCPRCGTPIRRDAFMNRSSYFCPHCQRRPRSRVRGVIAGRAGRST